MDGRNGRIVAGDIFEKSFKCSISLNLFTVRLRSEGKSPLRCRYKVFTRMIRRLAETLL